MESIEMADDSILGIFELKKRSLFKAMKYNGPSRIKEIENDVKIMYEDDGKTPMFINRDSIEVFTGSYYYPQFIGSSEPYPETVTVNPGEIIIIPIDPYRSTFKMSERDFHNFYELLR